MLRQRGLDSGGRKAVIVEANVNILTSLLILKKKTQLAIQAEDLAGLPTEYQVFMAVAEKVGYDRRGAPTTSAAPTARSCWKTRMSRNGFATVGSGSRVH